ncbi:MAG TPA: DNA recombination/repair protein RecA, partial [Alphaproteobacteria bacterium]|nr:DNA recombination/repair protein RecA [Alphaproteobacteria bacterium]
KVVKNKLAPPFRQVEFDIMYGEGISKTGEIIDLGIQANLIEKSGAWFASEGERIGQGRENAKQYLRDHPDLMARLEGKIRSNAGLVADAMLAGPETPEEAEAGPADETPPASSGRGRKGVAS